MTDDADAAIVRSGGARRRVAYIAAGLSLCTLGAIANFAALTDDPEAAPGADDAPEVIEEALDVADAAYSERTRESQLAPILEALEGERGHLLSSPYGEAFSTGVDDADVWGSLSGTEVGEAFGVGGLGLVGTGRGGGGTGEGSIGMGNVGLMGKGGGGKRTSGLYAQRGPGRTPQIRGATPTARPHAVSPEPYVESGFVKTDVEPQSTFSIDVDTASYSRLRDHLRRSYIPDPSSIRVEEMLNYFSYEDPAPRGRHPFAVTTEVAPCPWNAEHELMRIGIQGKHVDVARPPSNLVFLIDTSGSMGGHSLDLVKSGLTALAGELDGRDRVAIVTYAGASRTALGSTRGTDAKAIRKAIESLGAAGGTNGAAGIQRAYALAQEGFIRGGVNRVILATDGDFNVGLTSHDALIEMIEDYRKQGVSLSVLGVNSGGADHTMEQLADKGDGNYAFLDTEQEAHKVLVEQMAGTLVSIAKDVKLQLTMDPARVQSYRLVGYENRRLANRDFADDTKDAGELGSGHTVTALYELVPAADADPDVAPLSVELRYKKPEGGPSRLVPAASVSARSGGDAPSRDFRWAAAVAQLGMLLADSPHRGAASWTGTYDLARNALGSDASGRRCEMLELVALAAGIAIPQTFVVQGETDDCATGRLVRVERPEPPPPEPRPEPPRPEPPEVDEEPVAAPPTPEIDVDLVFVAPREPSLWDYVLGTLRLLPPILALPMFVMAFRRRRED